VHRKPAELAAIDDIDFGVMYAACYRVFKGLDDEASTSSGKRKLVFDAAQNGSPRSRG